MATTHGIVVETHDIIVQRGNTEVLPFRFTDGGSPVNLTGATIIFRAAMAGQVIRKSSADDIDVPAPADGVVNVPLTREETRAMQPGKPMAYELEYRLGDIERTLVQGNLLPGGGTNDEAA